MSTVCTLQLSKAIGFEQLVVIPRYFVFIALLAWLATINRSVDSFSRTQSRPAEVQKPVAIIAIELDVPTGRSGHRSTMAALVAGIFMLGWLEVQKRITREPKR